MKSRKTQQEGRKDIALFLSWLKPGAGLNIALTVLGLATAGIGGVLFLGGSALNLVVKNPAISSTISSVSTAGLLTGCTGFAVSAGVIGRDGGIKGTYRRFSNAWRGMKDKGIQSAIYHLLEPTDAEKSEQGRPPEPPPPPRLSSPPPLLPQEPSLNDLPAQNVQYVAKIRGLESAFKMLDQSIFANAVRNSSSLWAASDRNRIVWGHDKKQYGILTIGQGTVMFSFTDSAWKQISNITKDQVATIIVFRLLSVSLPQRASDYNRQIDRAWGRCRRELETTPGLYNYVQQFADGGGVAI